MSMNRRVRRSRRTTRRRTHWTDTLFAVTVANTGQQITSLMSSHDPDERVGMVLERTIISLAVTTLAANTTLGMQAVDVGIGVFSQEAFAAGAVPDPGIVTDRPSLDWVWRDRIMIQGFAAAPFAFPIERMLDLHAKRKIGDGELAIVIDNTNVDQSGFSIRLHGLIRTLFTLS